MIDPATARQQFTAVDKAFVQIALCGETETLAAPMATLLGPIEGLDPLTRDVLADASGTRYATPVLAAIAHAAQHSTSRTHFDRLLGLHGGAAHTHLHRVMTGQLFPLAASRGVSLGDVRKVLRRCSALVRASRRGPCTCELCVPTA
jgi:hypothetical protein